MPSCFVRRLRCFTIMMASVRLEKMAARLFSSSVSFIMDAHLREHSKRLAMMEADKSNRLVVWKQSDSSSKQVPKTLL